jgi:hypothetical protein
LRAYSTQRKFPVFEDIGEFWEQELTIPIMLVESRSVISTIAQISISKNIIIETIFT